MKTSFNSIKLKQSNLGGPPENEIHR